MHTPTLIGRRLVEADLPFVTRVWNDPKVAATIGGPRTDAQLRERYERWAAHWDEHGFGATLFRERAREQLIGWGGLQHSVIGVGPRLTVGYVIAPEAWGRNYATEIAAAAVAYAFDELGVPRVHASVESTNFASRRVLEKAGLVVEAEVDHGGAREVIYVIER